MIEREIDERREKLGVLGERVRERILNSDTELFLLEEERLEMRTELDANGVNFKPFENGRAAHVEGQAFTEEDALKKDTLTAQAVFCLAALSRHKMERVVINTLREVINQPGGGVYKKSDDEGGVSEPTKEEIEVYARQYLTNFINGDLKFAPKDQAKGIGWQENTIYRIEAIISATYTVLRTCAFTEAQAEDAANFQVSNRAGKFLRQRLIRGEIRALGDSEENKEARAALENRKSDEKIVRHLPSGGLEPLFRNLVGWE